MSALDQAFIKAYAKEAAPVKVEPGSGEAVRAAAVAVRTSRAPQGRAPLKRAASTQIENLYAAGTLYRIETPQAAEPEPVPSPHFATKPSRRLALRYRLAQMEEEENAPAVSKRQLAPAVQPAPQSPRRMKANLPPPALPETIDEPEVPAVAPTMKDAEEIHSVIEERRPQLVAADFSFNPVEVRQRWDELLGDSPVVADSAVAVWPQEADFNAAHASALISLDLETVPEPPVAVTEAAHHVMLEAAVETGAPAPSSAKSYRLDAAHTTVPAPHQTQPTVEELIQPAAEDRSVKTPVPKVQERPLVISAEEAAELVGAPQEIPPAPPVPSSSVAAAKPAQQIIPAWEVDRFLWPALCEKLLKDEQSYFAQAGGKIASAVRDGLKSLAITGSRRGEGRTTLALCLARSAAAAGLKVAIVDADFARPQLAASLGLEIAGSWHEVALGKTNLSEVAIKSVEDNLTVLPLDVSTAAAPLSLADPRLTKALRDATASFDLLVLDLGPTATGDSSLFPDNEPPPADAAIVVRDLRYCTTAESQAIGERLCLSGIEAVGIAENFVPQDKLVA